MQCTEQGGHAGPDQKTTFLLKQKKCAMSTCIWRTQTLHVEHLKSCWYRYSRTYCVMHVTSSGSVFCDTTALQYILDVLFHIFIIYTLLLLLLLFGYYYHQPPPPPPRTTTTTTRLLLQWCRLFLTIFTRTGPPKGARSFASDTLGLYLCIYSDVWAVRNCTV